MEAEVSCVVIVAALFGDPVRWRPPWQLLLPLVLTGGDLDASDLLG